MWILWCWVRKDRHRNVFPQCSHLYGFTPVWILWCWARNELRLKAFPQSSHAYGLSPVWVLWCWVRDELCVKDFPHSLHSQDFFRVERVGHLLWSEISLVCLPPVSHWCRLSSVETLRCVTRLEVKSNLFSKLYSWLIISGGASLWMKVIPPKPPSWKKHGPGTSLGEFSFMLSHAYFSSNVESWDSSSWSLFPTIPGESISETSCSGIGLFAQPVRNHQKEYILCRAEWRPLKFWDLTFIGLNKDILLVPIKVGQVIQSCKWWNGFASG